MFIPPKPRPMETFRVQPTGKPPSRFIFLSLIRRCPEATQNTPGLLLFGVCGTHLPLRSKARPGVGGVRLLEPYLDPVAQGTTLTLYLFSCLVELFLKSK